MAHGKIVRLEEQTMVTRMVTFEKTFRWRVENFFEWLDIAKKPEKSIVFEVALGKIKEPYQFCFTLFPRGLNDEAAGHVSLYLNNCSKEDVKIDYKLYIEGKSGSRVQICSGEKTRIERNNACGRSKAISISAMKECDDYSESLTIGCLVTVVLPEVISPCDVHDLELQKNVNSQESLTKNLSNVTFQQEHNEIDRFSDVKIQCDDDSKRTFDCHKIILSLRSPVFKAMFVNNYTESTNNLIIIKDIQSCTMSTLLTFIYTDSVNENTVDCNLLYAADKYQVLRLKAICELSIARSITVDNGFEVAISSYFHGTISFQQVTIEYLGRHWAEVNSKGSSEEIKKYPELLHKILCYVTTSTSAES